MQLVLLQRGRRRGADVRFQPGVHPAGVLARRQVLGHAPAVVRATSRQGLTIVYFIRLNLDVSYRCKS